MGLLDPEKVGGSLLALDHKFSIDIGSIITEVEITQVDFAHASKILVGSYHRVIAWRYISVSRIPIIQIGGINTDLLPIGCEMQVDPLGGSFKGIAWKPVFSRIGYPRYAKIIDLAGVNAHGIALGSIYPLSPPEQRVGGRLFIRYHNGEHSFIWYVSENGCNHSSAGGRASTYCCWLPATAAEYLAQENAKTRAKQETVDFNDKIEELREKLERAEMGMSALEKKVQETNQALGKAKLDLEEAQREASFREAVIVEALAQGLQIFHPFAHRSAYVTHDRKFAVDSLGEPLQVFDRAHDAIFYLEYGFRRNVEPTT